MSEKTTRRNLPKYVRNLYGSPASVRLENGRRITLNPRGNRGDLVPLKKDEETDAKISLNEGLLFEIISGTEAEKIIAKQSTNQQSRQASTLSKVTNSRGDAYEGEVIIEESLEKQGTKVADLEKGNVVIDRGVGIRRMTVPGSDTHKDAVPSEDIARHEQVTNAGSLEEMGLKVTIEPKKD